MAKRKRTNFEILNDDVLHIVLSFLPFHDLNQLRLVSKNNFRLSELAIDDCYHETNFRTKLDYFLKINDNEEAKLFYAEFLNTKCNFLSELINIHCKINEMLQFKYSQILPQLDSDLNIYKPFEEIKKSISLDDISLSKDELKITFCGDGGVGKTTLINTIANGEYDPDYMNPFIEPPISCYSHPTTQKLLVVLHLYDSYGQMTRIESFHHVANHWLPEIRALLPNIPIVLMACKLDLVSELKKETSKFKRCFMDPLIEYEHCVELAKKIGAITYLETSSFTGEGNISDFEEIIIKSTIMFRKVKQAKSQKKKCIIC